MTQTAIDQPLQQATRLLKQGDLPGALAAADAILAGAPSSVDALYLRTVTLRYLARLDDAEIAASNLLDAAPEFGRGWQELGHVLRAQGLLERAAMAYARAVERNEALDGAWRALAAIHAATGRADLASEAEQQLQWLGRLPRELVAAMNLIAEQRLDKAEPIVRAFLRARPTEVEAMRLLAAIGMAMNVLDDAEILLAKALEFAPENPRVHADYIDALLRRHKYPQAEAEAKRLLACDPGHVAHRVLLGNARVGTGSFIDAITDYDAVLAAWPQAEAVHLSRGHALKTIGRREEAIAAYRAAYGLRADFGDAYWSLANLKTFRFTKGETDAMAHWLAAPRVAEIDRIHLHFAYAKTLEDIGDYGAAFAQYTTGNALKLARSGYSPDGFAAEVEEMIAATPAALFAGAGGGYPAGDPIFIVGLPRAGSTLIEQILASHSQIEGTAELPHILAQVHALSGRDLRERQRHYPHNLGTLTASEFTEMGRRYIEQTAVLRSSRPLFIDKMPNNFRHIGLIARMLPQARIIDARREPMACCFSNFKQLFAEGQEFSYGLDSIRRYYTGYRCMMDHWHSVLPNRILTMRHEDVLDDLEGQVRRLLDFVSLPFEQSCICFHENDRAVRTASSEQVRRPIDRSGADQWRHFEPWLGSLCDALGPYGNTVRRPVRGWVAASTSTTMPSSVQSDRSR